ncbi:hypothetical protein [Lacipirellula limnantheis]|uniref:Uncharacterized protein n=1 Tax=Lacipirellula limnantheis TaxID=2528024 RepID=A0A517TYW4_9BACT|nr:hypothetical protein [Lacipirellula limnantheis]QDT73562.1 hypothetical protein I41_27510 [Lacipirellula limnantheis]
MKTAIPLGLVVLGALLLGLSLVWAMLFPAANGWTEEKALRMRELSGKAHLLSFKASAAGSNVSMHGADAVDSAAEYRKAQEELRILREEFEEKRDAPATSSSYLRWGGAAMILLGAMANMAIRRA